MIAFAKVGPWKQGYDVHKPHKAPDTLSVDGVAVVCPQVIRHLAVPPRGVLQMRFINDPHDVKIFLAFTVAWVRIGFSFAISACPIDFKQLEKMRRLKKLR